MTVQRYIVVTLRLRWKMVLEIPNHFQRATGFLSDRYSAIVRKSRCNVRLPHDVHLIVFIEHWAPSLGYMKCQGWKIRILSEKKG